MRLPGLLCFLLLAQAGALRAAAPVSLEAFAASPQTTSVTISPDGTRVAWCVTNGEDVRVVVFDTSKQKYILTFPIEKKLSVRWLGWVDDQTLLASVRFLALYTDQRYKRYFGRTIAIDVATGKQQNLLMADANRRYELDADVLSLRTGKPGTIMMSMYQTSPLNHLWAVGMAHDNGSYARLFEVDAHTGKSSSIETATYDTDEWLLDADGAPLARSEWNRDTGLYRIMVKDSGGWREILHDNTTDPIERPRLIGVKRDGTAVIVRARTGLDRSVLQAVPLDGSSPQKFFEDPQNEVAYAQTDPHGGAPVAVALGGLDEPIRFLDPKAEQRHQKVAAAFPGKRVDISDESANGQRVIARVFGAASPAMYYVVDLASGKADLLGEEYPALSQVELGPVRTFSYPASDGTLIPAYLTLPPAASTGKGLPLVILPHDGPEKRDHASFHWLAQFIASRGYVVLQPQFRGSQGFGEAWRKAGHGQWGELMQQDLTDGINALAKDGLVDAGRVCIVGVGYGGYAALTAATFTPKHFRCAVSVNGISNVPGWFGTVEARWSYRYWRDNIGSPFDQRVKDKSPLNAAAGAGIPILLMHATDDISVPFEQSSAMAHALEQLGKDAKLVKLENDGHDLERTATRVRALQELQGFLARHLR